MTTNLSLATERCTEKHWLYWWLVASSILVGYESQCVKEWLSVGYLLLMLPLVDKLIPPRMNPMRASFMLLEVVISKTCTNLTWLILTQSIRLNQHSNNSVENESLLNPWMVERAIFFVESFNQHNLVFKINTLINGGEYFYEAEEWSIYIGWLWGVSSYMLLKGPTTLLLSNDFILTTPSTSTILGL